MQRAGKMITVAGLLAISRALIKWHPGYCGSGALTVLPRWAIVVLGTLPGGQLLYALHGWAIRRGFAVGHRRGQ